jgi:hypothetical protein
MITVVGMVALAAILRLPTFLAVRDTVIFCVIPVMVGRIAVLPNTEVMGL